MKSRDRDGNRENCDRLIFRVICRPPFILLHRKQNSTKIGIIKSNKKDMAKTFTITLTDDLEEVITSQAERLNKSPEEIVLQVLSQQLTTLFQPNLSQAESDPLLRLIGSLNIDIPDLAENHDDYIGQALYQELKKDE